MRILITGAEQGLGKALRSLLEAHGHWVECLSGSVIRGGPEAIRSAVERFMTDGHGPFAAVVNNYGINHLSWIGTTPVEDGALLEVNVMGPYWVVDSLVRLRHPPCRVLNIASQTHRVPQRTTALYCASKAALVQMSRVMARELAPTGWTVNVLAPGKMPDTEMSTLTDAQVRHLRGWDEEMMEAYGTDLIPMRRYTSTAEVAEAAFLMLQMPGYVNGAVLDMTGGV